ncbi:MAG: hypothetical protein GY943_13190 [Chloroflexi bacterium]|nr:hypothetical protein [Chloroflexota bacterium]
MQKDNTVHKIDSEQNKINKALAWLIFFNGFTSLYFGIGGLIRVMGNREPTDDVSLLVETCIFLFACYFLATSYVRVSLKNGLLLQGCGLAVILFAFATVFAVDSVSSNSYIVRWMFGRDSSWSRDAMSVLLSFIMSATCLSGILSIKVQRDPLN